MTIKVYNNLTRHKEELKVNDQGRIGIYVCGPTVYDYFHIGNARVFIFFDLLRRYLQYRGIKTIYVQNFTDIDDKMIKRARELGISVSQLAERFISAYNEDALALGVKPADHCPRATEHIAQIIKLIQKLLVKGLAYEIDGEIYYDTAKFADYGKLSGQKLEDLEVGARIEVDERKRSPMDFVLWKKQKPGEPAWDSPWGKGRPGWHIECSAMSMHYLGETVDIHAGGPDLIFPHHENELAQSEGATGKPFVRYWLHVGYMNIDKEKMSKSLGNFLTVRELRKRYDPKLLRFFMFSAHYRSPINFSEEQLEQAVSALGRLNVFLFNVRHRLARCLPREAGKVGESRGREKSEAIGEDEEGRGGVKSAEASETGAIETKATEGGSVGSAVMLSKIDETRRNFLNAMDDDLNTADALAHLFTLARDANIFLDRGCERDPLPGGEEGDDAEEQVLRALLVLYDEVNTIFDIFKAEETGLLEDEVECLIQDRERARSSKDFTTADKIRDLLRERGIILEDTPHGVRWRFAKDESD